jgi:hypothetical protein
MNCKENPKEPLSNEEHKFKNEHNSCNKDEEWPEQDDTLNPSDYASNFHEPVPESNKTKRLKYWQLEVNPK